MPKTPVQAVQLRAHHGIDGDAHGGPGHRQISILGWADLESFKRTSGMALVAGAFAENLVISGLELGALGLGSRLRVGADAVLSLTRPTNFARCPLTRTSPHVLGARRNPSA